MIPEIEWNQNGLVLPAEQDILAARLADINAAFGGALNTTNLETPQGQLASSEAAIVGDKNNQFLQFVNGVDPRYSNGLMQDGIGYLYFLSRIPASSTVVTCDCMGATGTVIPQGSKAVDLNNKLYASIQSAVIPVGGTVSVPFACLETGPIPCPASTLTKIYQLVPGWDRITNPAPGVVGNDVESPREFEARRTASVFVNSQGSIHAIRGAILACPGVLDAYCYDNDTGLEKLLGVTEVVVPAGQIFVSVVGGSSNDVARAIWTKKSAGCPTVGNTAITVYDTAYAVPYPAYVINFERPASAPILFDVTIVDDPTLPSNITALIQNAIYEAFIGNFPGKTRERIGGTIYASRYYAPIMAAAPNAAIISVQLGTETATLDSTEIGVDQVPTIDQLNVTVTLS